MFLKSLTIQGFKSFANRVTIELPKGVAAVVGPNGSGKSNIADAVRWVLGEQSLKLLRGVRLEDVIFAGSDSKRPVGMAEVSITFDNTSGRIPVEYAEVTATRRVYRSGESDFFINRTPCRLRDIQELFMDTGIGRGSLAIIGQGEVEAILSARPEERRAFLEEAAGITRYQARKEEAVRRLQRAEEDLVRVKDIIREVERQLGPLESQAKRAEEHLALSERLRLVEVALLSAERRRTAARLEEASRAYAEASRSRDEARANLAAVEAKIAELSQAVDELDERIEARRAEEERLRHREVEARHLAERARERLERYEAEESERTARLSRISELLESARRSAEDGRAALRAGEAKETEAKAALRRAEEALRALREGIGEGGESLKSAQERLGFLSERIAAAESQRQGFQRELSGLGEERRELSARRRELMDAQSAAQATVLAREEALGLAAARLGEVRKELEEVERSLSDLRSAKAALERELAQKRRVVHDLAGRLKALSEMEEAREGYQRGVREVLEAEKERGWGLLGAVLELIEVPPGLETAIEVALGSAQQFVVARTDRSAKLAIEYLKEKRLGRATFLPLDSLRPNPLSKDARARLAALSGVVGVARDLVAVHKGCEPAVDYLLGRVVVAETLDAALIVSKRVEGVNRIVTVDGDVVIPGGAITGGSRSQRSEGFFSRRRQIAELRKSLKAAEAEAEAVEGEMARLDERLQELFNRAGALEKDRRAGEMEKLSRERDVKEARAEAMRIAAALADCDRGLVRLEQREQAIAREIESAAHMVAAMSEERNALRRRIEEYERALAGNREKEESLRGEVERLKVMLAAVGRENDEKRREVERLEKEAASLARSIAEEEDALAKIREGRKEAAQLIERSLEHERQAASERKAVLAAIEALSAEKSSLREEAQRLGEGAAAARNALEELQERAARLAVERERLQGELARIDEELVERGVAPEEASAGTEMHAEPALEAAASLDSRESLVPGPQAFDEQALRAEARALKKRLAEIGPVDPASIEEYRKARERYEFLTAQRDDLEEAKADLAEVIARIDRESARKLRDVYEELKGAFNDVFRRLFGGGRADLSFTDPENPLESGVEIFVQPPGKKLQNLMALSGGEKALAAIALLFGILTVRPSPFCVLDEIDAPLDEHNLIRFRNLLQEFSRSTQFLVITHRQPTMESADCLYGVTMEESGVSTLVSLKLEDVKSSA